MKKLLSILVLGLLLSGNAYALNFNQNLGDYEKNNPGNTATIYVLNRCSGILSYVSSLMFKENTDAALKLNQMGAKFVNFSSLLYAKHNNTSTEDARNISLQRMMQLEKLYRQDAKEMFLKKGRHLSGVLKFDLEFCTGVAKKFFNN
jgi:hypothetical protein